MNAADTTETTLHTTETAQPAADTSAASPSLIPGKKHAPLNLGRVLVVGLGKSGMAAVEYCSALLGGRVEALTVSAGKRNPKAEAFVESFAGRDIDFRFEYEDIEGPFDLCIVSPGISDLSPLYKSAAAASAEIVSELEFAWRESDADSRWIAITGTNGKTTTTSLIAHICKGAGRVAHAVGNIGEVALTCVWKAPQDIYVAEISSFQLATTSLFAPDVAVLLGITPDHLEWHGTMDRYIEAKARVLARAQETPDGVYVLDWADGIVRGLGEGLLAAQPDAHVIAVLAPGEMAAEAPQSPSWRVGEAFGHLGASFGETVDFGPLSALQIKGAHNITNALAAASAAWAVGVSPAHIRAGLATFAPLEHRIEPCGTFGGISYYNDSKGTNVDSTCKAFTAFTPGSIICLLGGHDKGTDLAPLVEAARDTCKAVVCYGESKARFLAAFGANPETLADGESVNVEGLTVFAASGMRQAARLAAAHAHPGDVVLLSPACSSFDEFTCYQERGRVFKDLVRGELAFNGR